MDKPFRMHSNYFTKAFGNLDDIATQMVDKLPTGMIYDTLVGTGLSGTLVVPTLARTLGTYWAIVRKEYSPHTNNLIEGEIGQKWLFVDDLIASGETRRRVQDVIKGLVRYESLYSYNKTPIDTEYVGSYLYESEQYEDYNLPEVDETDETCDCNFCTAHRPY